MEKTLLVFSNKNDKKQGDSPGRGPLLCHTKGKQRSPLLKAKEYPVEIFGLYAVFFYCDIEAVAPAVATVSTSARLSARHVTYGCNHFLFVCRSVGKEQAHPAHCPASPA